MSRRQQCQGQSGQGGGGSAPEAPGAAGEARLLALRPGFALEVQQACTRITEDVLALEEPAPEPAVAQARRQRAQRALVAMLTAAGKDGAR